MKFDFKDRHGFWTDHAPPYPIVPVTLIGRSGQRAATYALLDSGSDCCMFHSKWATRIGLNLHSGRLDSFDGIDPKTKLEVYIHRINIEIGAIRVRCDVAFSEDMGEDVNDQLIGRAIIFNKIRFAIRQRVLSVYTATEF